MGCRQLGEEVLRKVDNEQNNSSDKIFFHVINARSIKVVVGAVIVIGGIFLFPIKVS